MSLSHINTGTVATATSGASNPITCSPGYPASGAAGDLAVLTIVSRHDTEATPTVTAGGGETWTSRGSLSGGGGAFGAGTGPARLTWFISPMASGSPTAPTVNLAGTNTGRTLQAVLTVVRRSAGDDYEAVGAFGAEATAGTGWSQATTTDPGITNGDLLVVGYGVRDDQHAAFSAMGVTATSATIGAVSERADAITGNGNDQGIAVGTAAVTAGTGTAAPVVTATIGTSESGVVGVLRVREFTTPAGPELAVFESAYTTTTTPKTVVVTGALDGDLLLVFAGGDQSSGNDVTAATSSTTGGTTGSWTEIIEDLAGANEDWLHTAWADVTADGDVTVQVARTQGGVVGPWGFFVIRARGHGGIGDSGNTAHSATEVVNLTVAQDSAIGFASFDWDAAAVGTGWTPTADVTLIERAVQGSAYTMHAAYWLGQASGTRDYGSTGASGAGIKAVAVEILAASAGEVGTASGVFGFTGTAAGIPGTPGTAAGSFGFTGTALGKPFVSGTALGSFGFTGHASGIAGAPPVQGTGEGLFGFIGTAAGVPETFGVAVAAFGFTGTASGVDRAFGVAVAAYGFTGTAAGRPRVFGVVVGSFGFAGAAAGIPRVRGQAVGSFGYIGTANGFAGTPPVTGTAAGVFGFAGSAAGVPTVLGQAVAAFGGVGAAQGLPRVPGQVVGAYGYIGTAIGSVEVFAVAVGEFGFVGEAVSFPYIPALVGVDSATTAGSTHAATIAALTDSATLGGNLEAVTIAAGQPA